MKQANMMRLIYMTMFIAAFMPIVHSPHEFWMRIGGSSPTTSYKKEVTSRNSEKTHVGRLTRTLKLYKGKHAAMHPNTIDQKLVIFTFVK